MRPYAGPSRRGIDPRALTGKVMCGYQGWFTTPGDGSGRGWRHYPARGQFKPGFCGIDLWPDMSELDKEEKFPTPFLHADGRIAHVFSSDNRKTVLRHFQWMQQYGIDGVFVQRFLVELGNPSCDRVLGHVRASAAKTGRVYAICYDLTGASKDRLYDLVVGDWRRLVDQQKVTKDD